MYFDAGNIDDNWSIGSAGGGAKAKRDCECSVNIGGLSYQGLTSELGVHHDPGAATNYSFVGFGGTPGGAFNVGQDGLCSFSLQVFDAAGLTLDSMSMDVQVVEPEPERETCALMLAGLAGLADLAGLAPVGAVARLKAAWPSGSARRSG